MNEEDPELHRRRKEEEEEEEHNMLRPATSRHTSALSRRQEEDPTRWRSAVEAQRLLEQIFSVKRKIYFWQPHDGDQQ